ncbi:hypothetical protein Patl1_12275 [Pistacia atlantica]|uniref:Uncharacterized protein n=1 Tax=Pistacia atlantica TaxID=434234 RepID=A0ACC1A3P8_9ROSI|nr:hypothetical protein Patl1_12275 [Pistacia atlantica]
MVSLGECYLSQHAIICGGDLLGLNQFSTRGGFDVASGSLQSSGINILPLRGGSSPKFSQRMVLTTENYQVV